MSKANWSFQSLGFPYLILLRPDSSDLFQSPSAHSQFLRCSFPLVAVEVFRNANLIVLLPISNNSLSPMGTSLSCKCVWCACGVCVCKGRLMCISPLSLETALYSHCPARPLAVLRECQGVSLLACPFFTTTSLENRPQYVMYLSDFISKFHLCMSDMCPSFRKIKLFKRTLVTLMTFVKVCYRNTSNIALHLFIVIG